MLEKIKVNLSLSVYNILVQDMIRFEAFKPNGDINRNDFLNCVIYNFYQDKLKKRAKFKILLENEAILTDTSKKNKEKMISTAISIMDDYYSEDLYQYHSQYFMIYPTNSTRNFFNEIYEREVNNKVSFSSFIRRLLNEYAYLPQYIREYIAKRDEFIKLKKSCIENKIVIFYVSGKKFKVAPYKLQPSFEESYNYLLGIDLNSKNKSTLSIKLSKIYNVTVLEEKFFFSKEQQTKMVEIINNGIQYASGDILKIKIQLTKAGLKMLNFKFQDRPVIFEVAKDIFEISCTASNFINYFIPFGKELKIINNDEIKAKMANFYSLALDKFK